MKKIFKIIPFVLLFFATSCKNNQRNEYTITWKDYDGTILKEEIVLEGDIPSFGGISREDDECYSYKFKDWDKQIKAAHNDAIYTATYSKTQERAKVTIDYGGVKETKTFICKLEDIGKDLFDFNITKENAYFKGYEYDHVIVYDEHGNKEPYYMFHYLENMEFKAVFLEDVDLDVYVRSEHKPLLGTPGTVSGGGTYKFNTLVELNAEPNDGYIFVGWYDHNTLLSEDSTFKYQLGEKAQLIEARFDTVLYKLELKSINPYGHFKIRTNSMKDEEAYTSPIYVHWGERVEINAYSSHSLDRWFCSDDNMYDIVNGKCFWITMPNHDVELSAKWKPNVYVSVDNQQSQTPIGEVKKESVSNDEKETVIVNAQPKEGYEFSGWYDKEETLISKDNPYSIDVDFDYDLDLCAHFSPITYNISYDLDGGKFVDDYPTTFDINHLIDSSHYWANGRFNSGKIPMPTKEGEMFAKWVFADSGERFSSTYNIFGDISLTAVYDSPVYTATFYLNGGEFKKEVRTIFTDNYPIDFMSFDYKPIRKGYTFHYWAQHPHRSYYTKEEFYDFYDYVYYSSEEAHEDIDLFAVWTLDEYKISYKLNGGEAKIRHYDYDARGITCFPTPTKEGYTFVCWTLNGQEITSTEGLYGDIEIEAIFTQDKYTFSATSLNKEAGSAEYEGTYVFGDEVTVEATANEGYVFYGWYYDDKYLGLASKEQRYTFTYPSKDINLYALFVEEKDKNLLDQAYFDSTIPTMSFDQQKISYGLYPQTVVSDNQIIDNLEQLDDSYVNENGYYMYNNKFYFPYVANTTVNNVMLSNGEKLVNEKKYWFECEPIVWDVLETNGGNYFLFTDAIIDARNYVARSSYEYSLIRWWINGEFLDMAFFNDSYIITTHVNNGEGTGTLRPGDDTDDKAFLVSYNELHTLVENYNVKNQNYDFYKNITDFAKARGMGKGGWYWTRSTTYSSDEVLCAHNEEITQKLYRYDYSSDVGVCLAININVSTDIYSHIKELENNINIETD